MKRTFSAALLVAIVLVAQQPAASAAASSSLGYVTDAAQGRLLAVNLATGTSTVVGSFVSVANIGGVAYDTSRNTLFGVSPTTDSLYTLNRTTGAATLVGSLGIPSNLAMQGVAYDPFSNQLFATAADTGELFTINRDTGQAQLIGPTGRGISGLAVDPRTGNLYGSPPSLLGVNMGLYLIDKTTAARTPIGPDTIGYNGLAFDSDGTLYGVQNSTDSLYRINLLDGTPTLIGPLGVAGINPLGFEIVPVPEPASALLSGLALVPVWRRLQSARRERSITC
jgi:hypothetical protein